jgi:succinate dehydrogenase assembly factor 2
MFRASRQLRALTSAPTRRLLTTTPRALQQRPSMADDPYPLPLASLHVTPEQDRSGATAREPDVDLSDPNLPFPDPLPREGESIENLRARLLYQTRKRGTLESDLLMSTFGQEHMPSMSEAELKEFDKVCHPSSKLAFPLDATFTFPRLRIMDMC